MNNKKIFKVISLFAVATACVVSGVFALNTQAVQAATEDVFHELGASVRISEDKGIRFGFGLPESLTGDGYEIGTLIIPKDVLGDNELNHNDDFADEVDIAYEPIECTKNWVPHEKLGAAAKAGYNYYNAALTEIPELAYDRVLVARSYYKDSEGKYYYSDPIERSIGWVAAAALNNGEADEDKILAGFVENGYGETALTVVGEKELITAEETTILTASNDKGYRAVWSSSNEAVATVDKDGKITPVRSGETTVTATIGRVSASKTVYVVGDGLYSDQFAVVAYGNGISNYLDVEAGDDGAIVLNATYAGDQWWFPSLVLRKLASKAYYEKLIENGYTKLAFSLTVSGASATELRVFDTALSTFSQKDGVYSVYVDVQHIVDNYDTIGVLGTGTEDLKARPSKYRAQMFLMCEATCNPARNYIFTISNSEFIIPTLSVDFAAGSKNIIAVDETTTLIAETNVTDEIVWSSSNNEVATVENGVVTGVKGGEVTITATLGDLTASKTIYVVGDGLYSDQIGARINGWNQSSVADYCGIQVGENGEITVSSKFQANATYSPALILRNMYSKAYYEKLIANGYTKLAFNLAVEGDVTDLYVFGKLVSTFPVKDGVYSFAIDVQHIVNHYDTMKTIATSGNQVGQASSLAAKLISWKSPANDWSTVKNYVFTISNAAFMSTPILDVNANDVEIAYGETATLIATTNWDESFVVWSSSDETIATVENGVVTVTGQNWGEVTITATIAGVSVDTIITVNAPTQLEVEFAVESKDIITINGTTTLEATTDWNVERVVWSSSNNEVATVENGVVTGVKGGEVTITATLGELTASKTIYVVGDGLYSDQIGMRINGYQYHDKPTHFNMATGENGAMTITAQFSDSDAYYPMLMLRNMYSKAYYEKLIAEGYKKLTFSLAVGGDNASNVSDLYVFGKALPTFAKNASGAYQIVVDVQHIVTYYDNIYGIATTGDRAGQSGSLDKMLIAWKSPLNWSGSRNYVFTISNTGFRKGVLFSDDFGFRDGGVNKTYNGMTVDTGANGEIIIDATFNATATYGSFLMFNKMDTITYLGGLKGKYASFTFELTVEGGAVNDLHTFGTAKAISTCNKVSGKDNTYVVEIRLDMTYFTDSGWKSNMNTFMTSTGQAGSWNARSQMLLAWRYNGSNKFENPGNHAPRNYKFTIANFELRESLLYTY